MTLIQTSFQNNFQEYFETITEISKDDSQKEQTNFAKNKFIWKTSLHITPQASILGKA